MESNALTVGDQYFLIGNITDSTDQSQEVKVMVSNNQAIRVAPDPIPPDEENQAIFVLNSGTSPDFYQIMSLPSGMFVQPVPGVTDDIAAVEPDSFQLFVTPVTGETGVYWITMGPEITSDHLTLGHTAPGSEVLFENKSIAEASKQKWKFKKTSTLVKPNKTRNRKGLIGFLKKIFGSE